MGYAGGDLECLTYCTTSSPTYYNIGDYSESVQVDYDPARISYGQLLNVFWNSHNPTIRSGSRQYMSAIFYHDEEQKKLAFESKDREEARLGREIFTEIVPASKFYLAEAYHQKYYLRQIPELFKELKAIYPDDDDFIASTAAARLNGYAGGYGDLDTLKAQLNNFGLSEAGSKKLLEIAEGSFLQICPTS